MGAVDHVMLGTQLNDCLVMVVEDAVDGGLER